MSAPLPQSPSLEAKEKNLISPDDTEPSTPYLAPLEDVERATRPSKSKWMQLMTVLVSGVALFSDGYNIQVTGAPFWHVVLGNHVLIVQLIPTPF
jgi:hypothetical protein